MAPADRRVAVFRGTWSGLRRCACRRFARWRPEPPTRLKRRPLRTILRRGLVGLLGLELAEGPPRLRAGSGRCPWSELAGGGAWACLSSSSPRGVDHDLIHAGEVVPLAQLLVEDAGGTRGAARRGPGSRGGTVAATDCRGEFLGLRDHDQLVDGALAADPGQGRPRVGSGSPEGCHRLEVALDGVGRRDVTDLAEGRWRPARGRGRWGSFMPLTQSSTRATVLEVAQGAVGPRAASRRRCAGPRRPRPEGGKALVADHSEGDQGDPAQNGIDLGSTAAAGATLGSLGLPLLALWRRAGGAARLRWAAFRPRRSGGSSREGAVQEAGNPDEGP